MGIIKNVMSKTTLAFQNYKRDINITKNAMTLGVSVLDWTPDPSKYKNDNIHPCVRYIPKGFAGHEWWMVTTPYPDFDSTHENPILYWGNSRTGNLPPLVWEGGVVVENTPATGYNSDGCIYYDGAKLWVFWREVDTPNSSPLGTFVTYGCSTTDGITFSPKKVFAISGWDIPNSSGDDIMCPIVIEVKGNLKMFASYYEYEPVKGGHGIAIWDIPNRDLKNEVFTRTKVVGTLHRDTFDLWHMDLFKHANKLYCVASPQSGDEILLGESSDGENFKFWSTPLLSKVIAETNYLYKPTALVHQGILYLWHPKRVEGVNKIYMTQGNFSDILYNLEASISHVRNPQKKMALLRDIIIKKKPFSLMFR